MYVIQGCGRPVDIKSDFTHLQGFLVWRRLLAATLTKDSRIPKSKHSSETLYITVAGGPVASAKVGNVPPVVAGARCFGLALPQIL